MAFDFSKLHHDDDFLMKVDSNIWLMDNHKWALYVWELFRQETGICKFSLVHVDYHWDGVYDFFENPEEEAKLLTANLEQIRAMIHAEAGIQYDSFIAPAVVRGMFDSVHFFCRQNDFTDVGISDSVRAITCTEQFIYERVDDLSSQQFSLPLIFDLCLDLFNDSDMFATGEIWSDHKILEFINTLRPLIQNAALITVSLSFDYSGTEDDTRHLASIVLPQIIKIRSSASA